MNPQQRVPDFLIIGEAKCGTTSLWRLMQRHPHVSFAREKELHFFGTYRSFGPCGRVWADCLEQYSEMFRSVPRDKKCGEATPNYLSDPNSARWIAELLPAARIIVMLRDPVIRAWSHYWHQVRRGLERKSFDDALNTEQERFASGDPDDFERFSYATRGHYIRGLQRFASYIDSEQILILFLEDFRRAPTEVLERVLRHIGLDPYDAALPPEASHENRANYPRWPALDLVKRRVVDWAEQVAPSARGIIRTAGRVTRPLREYSGTPRMRDADANRLRAEFEASDHALREWLGTDVPWRDTSEPVKSNGESVRA